MRVVVELVLFFGGLAFFSFLFYRMCEEEDLDESY